MHNRKTLLVGQILITFMMATLMSGIMSLIAMGPTATWLAHWPIQILIAWPIAFCLTLLVSRFGFALAGRLTRQH